ncbi:DedA family protein [Brachybacterium sp. AOP43-C2-M15]|uniref:DedA family protein n=1 Tax=Brachybacterium sp. AOP43-C2-M15 TaxID=3457661 RepID=UPI0040331920
MNIVDWAVGTMDALGALGVLVLIFLENIFPPIPSEVILPLAGVTAAGPHQSYWVMLLASVAGSLAGAWMLYGLGRLLGPERLRTLFLRLPLVHVEDYDKTVAFMDEHGRKAIFFGRMVPGIRSLISIPAGLYAMPIGTFTLLTAAGSAIWNSVFLTIGYVMGSNWTVIEPYTDLFSTVVYVLIGLVVLWFAVQLIRRERTRRAQGLPDPDEKYRRDLEPGREEEQGQARDPGTENR